MSHHRGEGGEGGEIGKRDGVGGEGKSHEFIRYVLNGVVATLVHFAALSFLLELVGLPSAGLSNVIADIAECKLN